MATTSLWAIHERLDHVLDYASNEEKTMEIVLKYATNENKTEQKEYVSCINCSSVSPFKSMMRTKEIFHTESKILGYHGYQSFKIGEGTAEQIHEIGIQTAKELWGERFEVVVATHLDKGHLHNHFVINSTSYVDGKMFHYSKKDIYRFRDISDKYCIENGLSIVENPIGKGKKRTSYQAIKSFIKEIKNDIDQIIPRCFTFNHFLNDMKLEGYEFEYKNNEHYILHPNFDTPIPMKLLGYKYQFEQVKERILAVETLSKKKSYYKSEEVNDIYFKYKRKQLRGFQYYFVHWQVILGILPERKIKKKLSKEMRKECKKLDRISDQTLLLFKHNITNIDELNLYRTDVQKQLEELIKLRKDCYYNRKIANENDKKSWSEKAKSLTPEIKKLRYELKCIDEIEERSIRFEKQVNDLERTKIKEVERVR
ncbi:MAG: relaxase/mobilization nuclease domain-containing protein [Erysipelotrichaceae bacterium]|nr:relaxase/mobilization nuclease domain-containing protein [Erysipelotrichaceae bacterium]